MIAIYPILIFFLVASISHADEPRWQNEVDIKSWIKPKITLEIDEYIDIQESLIKINRDGRYSKEGRDIWKSAETLAFNRFADLLEVRDHARTCEFFEGVGFNYGLKLRMMNALAEHEDIEFSALIVHHALGGTNWTSDRGFNVPHLEARWKLFNRIMGESETLEKIFTEYGDEIRVETRNAMKLAIEKKWPQVLEKTTKTSNESPDINQSAMGEAKWHLQERETAKLKKRSVEYFPWYWIAAPLLFLAAVFRHLRMRK